MPAIKGNVETPHPLEGIPRRLWRLVLLAHHRLLMLDYDGTLAPFHVARDLALPQAHSLELLRAIATDCRTTVAIVSGRPTADLAHLLGPLPVTVVGEHGWENRLPDGAIVKHPVSRDHAALLDAAERLVRNRGLGVYLERKRTGVVLHTRGCSAVLAHEVEEAAWELWRSEAERGSATLERIDGGVELRLRGRNKGTAVLSLVSHAPPDSLAVFVGDDATDEDAFEAVREWGFGVRVGEVDRPTLAAGRLPTCASVVDFLEEWLQVTREEAGRRVK
jgi:trehalose 6-phosphate phosphatase